MRKIEFVGWNEGLEKISTTRLFQKHFLLSLSESKRLTDQLLDGERFTLTVPVESNLDAIVQDFTSVGVLCKL